MPWRAVATRVAGYTDVPLIVLGRDGHIHLASQSAARMLGTTVAELVGTSVAALCPTPDAAEQALRALRALPDDGPQALDLQLRSDAGRVMHVALRGDLVGDRETRVLVASVTLTRVEPVIPAAMTSHLEISTRRDGFGVIRHVWRDDGGDAKVERGLRCHEWMEQAGMPCTGSCPVMELPPSSPSVTMVRTKATGEAMLFTARLTGEGTATLSVQPLPPEVLDDLAHAKRDRLIAKAGLSGREREVLDLLLLGRSHEDIAQLTGIGVRTVKFHQGRLLAKLGAESRFDLMRLLL